MSWIEDPGISYFQGFNISQLGLDEAWVNVTSFIRNNGLWIYELSSDCHKCPFEKKSALNYSDPYSFKVSTKFPKKFRIRTSDLAQYVKESGNDSFKVCDIEPSFGEFGVYNIYINDPKDCRVETVLEPVNIYYPLLLAFLFYLIFGLLLFIVSKGHKSVKSFCVNSSSSGSSKTSSSTTVDRESHVHVHGQGTRNGNGIEQPSFYPSVTGPIRISGGNGSMLSINHNRNPNGHYGYLGQNHNHPQYNSGATTEVSISTISSTPTSTAVTTYAAPPPVMMSHIDNSCSIMDPQGTQNNNNRIPANANHTSNNNNASQQPNNANQRQRQRLKSLDTFRGICIIIMIFVNDGGGGYYFFGHATWDGLYVADLVFPWFLWIMGVCIPVSIKSQVKRGNSRLTILKRILLRSCKLVLLGVVLPSVWGPVDIHSMRIPGILQRFGICYFVCSVLVLFCMTVNITKPEASKLRAALQDVQIIWIAWLLVLVLVLAHCMLTFFLEVPGCPTGYLGAGGLHDYFYEPYRTIPAHCVGGAAGYIDQELFQPRHLYQWLDTKFTYKTEVFDPEGVLGTFTAIFQVWLGVQAGVTMLVYPRASSRLKRWGVWALINGLLGALLSGCKQTGWWIPINKSLWSLSFVLVTTCFAFILLSALYFIIDIKRYWSGTPFFEPGMNSILLYVGHQICHAMLPFHYKYGLMRTHFARLIESLWGTSLWVLIAVYLYVKKIFWVL